MTKALTFLLQVSLGHPAGRLASPSPSPFEAQRVMASTLPVTGSTSCPEGGHVGVDGTFDVDTAGNSIFVLTDTLVECGVKDNHSNVWTFTSEPTLAVTLELLSNIHGDTIDVLHSSMLQSDVGQVRYSTGNVSGTCSIDVDVRYDVTRESPTPDSATIAVTTAGNVCGRAVMATDTSVTPYTPRT